MLPPTGPVPRQRNAAATREAILASATRQFARESYEHVGVRDIAGEAGVDPSLVSRYFGGKEQLFKEVLRGKDPHILADVSPEGLPTHFAELIIEGRGCEEADAKVDRLLILLRSASSPQASQIVSDAMHEDILEPIAGLLSGTDGALRASLCMAVVMGVGILRTAMGLPPLRDAEPALLRRRLAALFAAALAGEAELA